LLGLSKSQKNTVAIIGGDWKRKKVNFSDKEELRPTLGRVRETLFNWLNQDLTSLSCLDLFAGTGALGFEALSRNARSCVMIEKNKSTYEDLITNKQILGASNATIINCSAESFLIKNAEKFDVIFFDPPFAELEFTKALSGITTHLKEHGLVYYESNSRYEGNELKIFKSSRAGQVYFYLLGLS
jgi:16S rRNA (guanine966-N2)-methyltransferase